jgi:hypothetical protein
MVLISGGAGLPISIALWLGLVVFWHWLNRKRD